MARSIACIIVTFKKPGLLNNCISGVLNQSKKPELLIVVDNNSEDDTKKLCLELLNTQKVNPIKSKIGEIYSGLTKGISTYYLKKKTNDGGAGGFFDGINFGLNQTNADYFWLMDDDGVPERNCLEKLFNNIRLNTILNPIVLDIQNKNYCSFLKDKQGARLEYKEIIDKSLSPEINPFNGTFISRDIIERFGNIKKEMFIWGDEMEYTYRMQKNKISLKTIIDAKHYHPKNKKLEFKKLSFNIFLRKIDNKYFEYVYYRNRVYNDRKYAVSLKRFKHLIRSALDALCNAFFHLKKGGYNEAYFILLAVFDGLIGNFKRTLQKNSKS